MAGGFLADVGRSNVGTKTVGFLKDVEAIKGARKTQELTDRAIRVKDIEIEKAQADLAKSQTRVPLAKIYGSMMNVDKEMEKDLNSIAGGLGIDISDGAISHGDLTGDSGIVKHFGTKLGTGQLLQITAKRQARAVAEGERLSQYDSLGRLKDAEGNVIDKLKPEELAQLKAENVQTQASVANGMKQLGGIDQPEKGIGLADTDVERFVQRAGAQILADTGEPATPGELNNAALEIKRAQASEVAANRLAERTVDVATAEKIKFNSETGTQLARIATAGALIKAKGEQTPLGKINTAKIRMGGNLATLANHYIKLDSTGAMINVDNNTFENVVAAMRASQVGQAMGRITGSNEQSIRASIKKLKPLLIQDIRQSTDMGARGLDSEKELEFYLQAATDEKTDIQSNIAAIVVLDEAFGNGEVSQQLRGLTDESLISRISSDGQVILQGGDVEKPTGQPQEGQTATNPQTGEQIIFRGGQWQPI